MGRKRYAPEIPHDPAGPMVEMVAETGLALLHGRTCGHCHLGFETGQTLFISGDYQIHLHRTCLEALVGRPYVDREYEAIRTRIFTSGQSLFDE